MTNNVSQVLGVIGRDLLGLNSKIRDTERGLSRMKLAVAGLAGVVVGGAALEGMAKLVEHGTEFVHQQSLMRQAGIDQIDIARATAAAWKTAGDVIGTSATDNLALVGDLRNRLGDMSKSILALPEMAKVGAVLAAGGNTSAEKAGDDFARFLELRGSLVNPQTEQIDPERLKAQARLGEAIAVGTRFKVGPQELLAFQQQARAAGASMSDQGLINAVPYIQAGGGSRTGTQVSSLMQQILGGVITKAGAQFLEHAGVLDAGKVHEGRGGHMTIDKGAVVDEQLLRTDWASWINTTLRQGLVKAGDKTVDEQTADLMRSHLRATVVGLLVEGIRSAPAFTKDASLINTAYGTDQYATMMGLPQAVGDGRRDRDSYGPAGMASAPADPTAKMKAFKDAWENLLTALGVPMVDDAINLIGKLTDVLTKMGQWAANHPEAVGNVEKVTAALAALMVVGGGLSIAAAALSPFTAGIKGLVGALQGAEVTKAISAAETLGAGAGVAGSILSVATGIAALGVAFYALPRAMSAVSDWLDKELGIKPGQPGGGRFTPNADPHSSGNNGRPGRGDAGHALSDWFTSQNSQSIAPSVQSGTLPNGQPIPANHGRQPSGPVHVYVTNGKDIADGTANHIATQAERAPTGSMSSGPRVTPWYPGMTPAFGGF